LTESLTLINKEGNEKFAFSYCVVIIVLWLPLMWCGLSAVIYLLSVFLPSKYQMIMVH